jgi:uncharacterized repeat protein (TIGR01451 family)
VNPDAGNNAPNVQELISQVSGGVTLYVTGLSVYSGASAEVFVDGPASTAVAVANVPASATITYAMANLDGSSAGTVTAVLGANAQAARFISELFPALPATFRGVLKITTSASTLSVSALLFKSNNAIVAIPSPTNLMTSSSPMVIPHSALGGGYSTQYVLMDALQGQSTSGHVRFFKQDGTALSLGLNSVVLPNLTLVKTASAANFIRGATGSFSLTVTNSSGAATIGTTVTVTDTLPGDLSPTAASGTGWTCGIAAQTVTCTRSNTLAVGSSYPIITIAVNVAPSAAASLTNTASVTGGGDTATKTGSVTVSTTP